MNNILGSINNGRGLGGAYKARFPLLIMYCFLFTLPCFAQNRDKMTVYIPLPTGGTQEQRAYFQSSFQMELVGANYPSADSRDKSLFTFLLDIQDNPEFDSSQPVSDDNTLYNLGIKLERSSDSLEIVSFSFPFSDTATMSDWNLFLLYQAMANAAGFVPPDEESPDSVITHAPIDDRWRNQWLYLNMAVGLDSGHFQRVGSPYLSLGMVEPMTLVGAEFHFMDHFSLEVDPVKLLIFINDWDWIGCGMAFPLLLKAVFKFSNIMLEPYAGPEFGLALGNWKLPWLFGIAGVQLGFKGSTRSAITLDVSGTLGLLGNTELSNGASYSFARLTIAAGWKLGFFDRPER